MQITSAMKMVSAAKLSRAQDAITQMRPYSEKLTQLLQDLSATLDDDASSKYAEEREVNNVLIVAVSSNKGLAGAFNTNIIKAVKYKAKNDYKAKNIDIYTVGKKANDILKKEYETHKNNNDIYDDLSFENASAIAEELMQLFLAEKYDKFVHVYPQQNNAGTQVV